MRLTLGLLALALAVAGCGGSGSSGATGVAQHASASAGGGRESLPSASGAATKDVAAVPATETATLAPSAPRVIKTARLELRVAHGRIGTTVIDAARVAGANGGYVLSTDDARQSGYAELVMRVPAARFTKALAALSTLSGATVTAQTVTGQEVGQEFVDLAARETNLKAQEAVLRRLMGRAESVSDTIRVENQLADVQGGLDQIEGRLRYLADQTALSTITVELSQRSTAPPGKPSTFGAALRRGWRAAQDVVAAAIVAIGFLLPLALLVAVVLVIGWRLAPHMGRLSRRRSNEVSPPAP